MFDEFFMQFQRELKEVRKEIAEVNFKLQEGYRGLPVLCDTKLMAKISGIPYNTLVNQKGLLPEFSSAVWLNTKRYYPREVVKDWLEDLSHNGRQF